MSVAATVHASAVAIGADGILIRGPSGSGKSSLVLGLIDRDPAITRLVADDRVRLAVDGGAVIASAPATLAGRIEVRGLGIVDIAHVSTAAIRLVVDLMPPEACPRMPEPEDLEAEILGVVLPRLMLPFGAADGPVRVRFAVRRLAAAVGPGRALGMR